MLTFTSSEIRVIRVWAEKGESSPFAQEIALLTRIKKNSSSQEMKLTTRELEIILHWAELERQIEENHKSTEHLHKVEEYVQHIQ